MSDPETEPSPSTEPLVLATRTLKLPRREREVVVPPSSPPSSLSLEGLSESCFTKFLGLLAWGIILPLFLIAVLRLFFHDGVRELAYFNAFTLYVYLPAYFCLAWAVGRRRWKLAGWSMIVVGCHLVWTVPDFLPLRPSALSAAELATASSPIRIFCANVAVFNDQYEAMLEEITREDPDIVVFVEYGRAWHRAVEQSEVLRPFVHRARQLRPSPSAFGVYSKLPLSEEKKTWTRHHLSHTFDVQLGSQSFRLFCLHAPRPSHEQYDSYWASVGPILAEQPAPLVVVGDFNATQHSRALHQLTSGRLRSAHVDRGRGFATTWPNGQLWPGPGVLFWVPPIRIDHVLLSRQVHCEQVREGVGRGSDHRPVIVDLRLLQDE